MLPCQNCAYVRSIPGNCHLRCVFAWNNASADIIDNIPKNQGSPKTAQWFGFPFNYDPVWGPDKCPAFSIVADDNLVEKPNPLMDLLSLLG